MRGESHMSFPSMTNVHFDDAKYPKARPATAMWKRNQDRLVSCQHLLKFGKQRHLEPLMKAGELRIGSASSYKDERLPLAIRDDETQIAQVVGPVRFKKTDSDYYLSSYAIRFENRLFDDFDADACLIVHDLNAFGGRLQEAFESRMPGWTGKIGFVNYFDPRRSLLVPDVAFAKHFRYGYQMEFRFVWVPPEPMIRLQDEYLNLELGDLSTCCNLLVL